MRALIFVVVWLGMQAAPAWAADPAACTLARVAEWPIRFVNGRPIVEGAINGTKINVLVHTAASYTLMTKAAAENLRLTLRDSTELVVGPKGETSRLQATTLDELRIAASTSRNVRVRVGIDRPVAGVDLILGADFLAPFDIELDLAGGVMRLFQARDCGQASLAYWDRNARSVALERGETVRLPMAINGRAALAELDSGAYTSAIALDLAGRAGIRREDMQPAGCNAAGRRFWMAQPDSIEIGDQVTRNPRVYVEDYARTSATSPDIHLGIDFLRAHRVLIARSQGKLYFSHNGAQIFLAIAGAECDDRFTGKEREEWRAAVDRALTENPRDPAALVRRAERTWQQDPAAAIKDLDVVIEVQPGNASAYALRANAREQTKDHQGALADSAAALERGLVTANVYSFRSQVRRAMGDHIGAVAECDAALRINSSDPAALRGRARSFYYLGRFENAERDLARVLAIRSNPFDSLWLAMTLERSGRDPARALGDGLAAIKDGAWPAPVMEHLMGRRDAASAIAAAASPDEKTRKEHECEARFYLAARMLARSNPADARPLLQRAVDECPATFIEREAAVVELEKLK